MFLKSFSNVICEYGFIKALYSTFSWIMLKFRPKIWDLVVIIYHLKELILRANCSFCDYGTGKNMSFHVILPEITQN